MSASDQSDELWILAAGRGPGSGGSTWITDLSVMNVSEEAREVEITFFDHAGFESTESFTLEPSQTLTLPDVIGTTFGEDVAFGALRIEVVADPEEQDTGEDDSPLVAHARIYDRRASGTVGQALEGLSTAAAISSEGPAVTTHIVGVANNSAARTNWFALNVSDPEEDDEPAEVLVEILNAQGDPIASKTYFLEPHLPVFFPLSDVAPNVPNGTMRFTMEEGKALFGASRIDMITNDPTTLGAHTRSVDESDKEFTETLLTDGCTYSSTGGNAFFPLTPGLELVLEGDHDGELVRNTIKVTSETVVIDGVTTRVVTETELIDGKLVEKSRNFYAECVETGDVLYFGEEVDIYKDGVIVNHNGAWRSGVNGARPGIIMTGRALTGSRYSQEIAPGIALDRAEHVKTGFAFETAAGTFTNCLSVHETTPLEPGSSSFKVYCRGIGIVFDSGSELVSRQLP